MIYQFTTQYMIQLTNQVGENKKFPNTRSLKYTIHAPTEFASPKQVE
jgi:hypothetical protein